MSLRLSYDLAILQLLFVLLVAKKWYANVINADSYLREFAYVCALQFFVIVV